MKRQPVISKTAWLTARQLAEQKRPGQQPHGLLHIAVPHGAGTRVIEVQVTLEECLILCANAADAARLLAPYSCRATVSPAP